MEGKKALFNFYLDNRDKVAAIEKLEQFCGKKEKGQLAAFLRVCIKNLIQSDSLSLLMIKQIDDEYEYSATKNKRSSL